MAHTKRGRDRKARRDAHQAELRVLEADVAAFEDDSPAPVVYENEHGDVDAVTLVTYLSDPDSEHFSAATESAETSRATEYVERTPPGGDD